MKLCLVYSPKDTKLVSTAYCSIFKDMFLALIERFNCKCFVTGDCNAQDIDADVIFFFDPHAQHHINIQGVDKHHAIKMEYWNDMHQEESKGVYRSVGVEVHKLGQEQRAVRAYQRGTRFIVSAAKYAFYDHFGKYFGTDTESMFLHFPFAPVSVSSVPFDDRNVAVLGNGAIHGGYNNGYDFRAWAFKQPCIEFVEHCLFHIKTPKAADYGNFLSTYAGALALCTPSPVPKYYEIPAAGCVTFAEYHLEHEELGFKDMKTCIYVNKDNFVKRVEDFLDDPDQYQGIADEGRRLIETKYTAKHFAEFIHKKVRENILQCDQY